MENFKKWLISELKERGWSYRELERRAGKNASNASTTLIFQGKRPLTWDYCEAVARALGYSPIYVFRQADLLPNGYGMTLEQLQDLAARLPVDKQTELLKYAEYLSNRV